MDPISILAGENVTVGDRCYAKRGSLYTVDGTSETPTLICIRTANLGEPTLAQPLPVFVLPDFEPIVDRIIKTLERLGQSIDRNTQYGR